MILSCCILPLVADNAKSPVEIGNTEHSWFAVRPWSLQVGVVERKNRDVTIHSSHNTAH